MEKQSKTYRLPDDTVNKIAEIAQREHCSATQAIVKAIDEYCANKRLQDAATGTAPWDSDFLITQLDTKNKQINDLLKMLDQSQQITSVILRQLTGQSNPFQSNPFTGFGGFDGAGFKKPKKGKKSHKKH